jgi:hypothetical protein
MATMSSTSSLSSAMAIEIELRDVIESDFPIFFEHQCDAISAHMAGFGTKNSNAMDARMYPTHSRLHPLDAHSHPAHSFANPSDEARIVAKSPSWSTVPSHVALGFRDSGASSGSSRCVWLQQFATGVRSGMYRHPRTGR